MRIYKLIVGSGADPDEGLDCYVVGDFDCLEDAINASEDIAEDDKPRAWIDVIKDGIYDQHYEPIVLVEEAA
jgi:hypothetical protein